MAGAIALVVGMALVLPAVLFLGGAALSGVLGDFLRQHAEDTHEGSELISLNR